MKKNKVATLSGSFTDFAGTVREFCIAAVSIEEDNIAKDMFGANKDFLCKKLQFGISVRNKDDKFNKSLGEKIAIGKAEKRPFAVLYSTSYGLINAKMVNAALEQEAEHFMNDPGSILVGYDADKEKYFAKLA